MVFLALRHAIFGAFSAVTELQLYYHACIAHAHHSNTDGLCMFTTDMGPLAGSVSALLLHMHVQRQHFFDVCTFSTPTWLCQLFLLMQLSLRAVALGGLQTLLGISWCVYSSYQVLWRCMQGWLPPNF